MKIRDKILLEIDRLSNLYNYLWVLREHNKQLNNQVIGLSLLCDKLQGDETHA